MIEDEVADAELISEVLRRGGINFGARRVEDQEGLLRGFKEFKPDLILSDHRLPAFDGLQALALARKWCPDVPFIFVTGTLGEEVAIETLKKGATDYVLKNRLSRLVPSVHRSLSEARERARRKRAQEKLRHSHEQLRALSMHLQSVREEERTRISREVHDGLGQALTGLKLELSWLAHRLPSKARALTAKARAMSASIDETIQTVRRISTELRPGILDDLGLAAAIEWQTNDFQNKTGVQCTLKLDLKKSITSREIDTALFRIFQETLTNIIRHAQATRVEVALYQNGKDIVLEVKDNGRGISEEAITNSSSLGLLGMRERAALLGGQFHVEPRRRGGTRVVVSIPGQPAPKRNNT